MTFSCPSQALLAYLYDPEKTEEITFQEKSRFEEIIEQMRSDIEVTLDVDSSSITRAEVVHLTRIALSSNRTKVLRAVLDNRRVWLNTAPGTTCVLELPQRTASTGWQWWHDKRILATRAGDWASVQMKYNKHTTLSGSQLLMTMASVSGQQPPESMLGARDGRGFVFLYGLLVNSVRAKVRGHDDRVTTARLMWHYFEGAHTRGNIWSSVISIVLANPDLVDALPKFVDSRTNKSDVLLGRKTEEQPNCPLDDLMNNLIPILEAVHSSGDLKVGLRFHVAMFECSHLCLILRCVICM